MELGRRNTRSFSFKEPEIEELKSLIPKIESPTDFQKKYGSILPHEEPLETVNLGTEEDRKEVQVGANLEPKVKGRLVQLLNEYVEIFAWSYEDMPGLDTDIMVHRLPTREDCPPIKQKVLRIRPDMSEKIKAEVM